MVDFGRDICGNLQEAERRGWLVTNGIGGYAAGTIAGVLTRRYHGLLIAARRPPLGRMLLVTALNETAEYAGRHYPLFTNRWHGEVIEPQGYHHIERFRLEGTTPVWTFACGDALLEKRVWMQQGANTTYIRYDLLRGGAPVTLTIKALVNYRDHHGSTQSEDWQMGVDAAQNALRITPMPGAAPFFLLSDHAAVRTAHDWYRHYDLRVEAQRGLSALDDNLHVGTFTARLEPGAGLIVVATAESSTRLAGAALYAAHHARERQIVTDARLTAKDGPLGERRALGQLHLAARQFIVRRASAADPDGHTVIAGYPWFGDWGRDTMIALPGLTLTTGRADVAANILRTFAGFVDEGMLPNRFPDGDDTPEYNTVDATLWYFQALAAYHTATDDLSLVEELFPVLAGIIDWHERGTRYGIRVSPEDGLLTMGEEGVQLTWMDAKVGSWVVTPRAGKAVEVNALWYNALRHMAEFARRLEQPTGRYETLAARARAGFTRFWNAPVGYCFDVLDGPDGNDPALRPNQLLAVSLPYSPLDSTQQRAVVDACARHLLTSHGLRSLAADDPGYRGHYGGSQHERDAAYHQGTVWTWLIGPFVEAHLRVYRDARLARSFLRPLLHHVNDHGLGSISEIFDGDAPFTARGAFAQAWSVAEVLRAWKLTATS